MKGPFLQGATFIDGNKIVVGLTARGKEADKFWFSLFHEFGHIILGHVGKNGGTTEQDEQDADVWSRDELIPLEAFKMKLENGVGNLKVSDLTAKNFSVASVKRFAKENKIAPGIVVGRLQNEGCIEYNMLNELKEHYVITV